MKCEQFELRLNEILDERESPEGDLSLQQHAAQCHRCARTLEASLFISDFGVSDFGVSDFGVSDFGEFERPFLANSAFEEMLDDGFSARVVKQAILTSGEASAAKVESLVSKAIHANSDDANPAGKQAIEAELVETSEDRYRDLERTLLQKRRRWRAPILLASAAALLVLVGVPIVSLIGSSFNPPNEVARQPEAIESSIHTVEPAPPIRPDSAAMANRGNFLGPTPFSTGGNIAVTLSVIPIPIDEIGIDEYLETESIDAVMPIANSLSLLVDRIWQSIPSLRLRPISIPSSTSLNLGVERMHLA